MSAALSIVIALPVVPASRLESTPIGDLNEDAIETVGWPELADTVADVFRSLPPAQRATAVVFTGNYGEAGAIDRYGPALGLPRAYSAHNAYARFGVPPDGARAGRRSRIRGSVDRLRGLPAAATIDNGVGLENEEQGGTVFLCTSPRGRGPSCGTLRHLDA